MSNYLEHLISRGFDHIDHVQPRLLSLFEPSPETVGLKTAFAVENEISQSTAALEVSGREQSASHPSRNQWYEPTGQSPTGVSLQGLGNEPQEIQEIKSSVPNQAAPSFAPLESRLRLHEQELLSRPQSPVLPPSLKENSPAFPVTVRTEGQTESLSETTVPPRLPVPSPSPDLSARVTKHWGEPVVSVAQSGTSSLRPPEITTEQLEQKYSAVTSAIEPTLLTPPAAFTQDPLAIRPATVVLPTTEVSAPRGRSLERQTIAIPSSPSFALTIQVTIGRIEVRATPPASAPPKSRPAPPVMNLDDYLRQRGGGK